MITDGSKMGHPLHQQHWPTRTTKASSSILTLNRGVAGAIRILLLALGVVQAMGLSSSSGLLAQTVAPPPGFSPSQGDDPVATGPASIMPIPPRTYSGSGEYFNPYADSNVIDDPSLTDDGAQPRPTRRRMRTFRTPPEAVIIPDEEPPMPRFWFRGEGLYWWTKGSPLPVPLVTQGSLSDSVPGALGQPGTSVIMGNQTIGLPGSGGGRFTLGFTFDAEQTMGVEGSYFYLGNVSTTESVSSSGSHHSPLLSLPYYDPTGAGESASAISNPGNYAGYAALSVQSQLQGADLNFVRNYLNSNELRVDFLGGLRYVNLREDLNFQTQSPDVGPPYAFYNTFDDFSTNNNFYGGQVGVRASYDPSRFFFLNATTKLALGDMFENVTVNGGTFTNVGGGFSSANGAYLTGPTNIGSQTRSQFAVIPEMNLNLGIRLRPWASVIIGYSFLYISAVARPGDQIDRVINPANAPAISGNFSGNAASPARPGLSVSTTDYWAQGLNFTLEFRF